MAAEFTIVKKGYDPNEVDEYVTKLEEVIKSYKEKDISIKNAIISAQIAADNIVKNAEAEAIERKADTIIVLQELEDDIKRQKKTITEFQEDYNNLIKKYLTDFNDREFLKLFNKINILEESISKFNKKIVVKEKDKAKEE